MKQVFALTSLVLLLPRSTPATERHWVCDVADLIVIGKLHPLPSYPGLFKWRFGWRLRGTLEIDEVLLGQRPPNAVELEFPCPSGLGIGCRYFPPPTLGDLFEKESSLFFLRNVNGSWQTPGQIWNPGFAILPVKERAYWEDYIRQRKRQNNGPKKD